MKKIAWMFALALPFAFASCGDDDDKVITLDQKSIELNYGADQTLKAQDESSKEVKNGTWASSNEFVATVNSDGKVEAKHVGTATITVSKDGASASCQVTVKATDYSFVLPVLTWGKSMDNVFNAIPSTITATKDESEGTISATTKDTGFPVYAYIFENDALASASMAIELPSETDTTFTKFISQYYKQIAVDADTFTITYADGNTIAEATTEVNVYSEFADENNGLEDDLLMAVFTPANDTKGTRAANVVRAQHVEIISKALNNK